MAKGRSNFYPDGTFIPYSLPQDFRQSTTKEACGNCGLYSNRRQFCGKFTTVGVKDNYICNQWRQRYFKR